MGCLHSSPINAENKDAIQTNRVIDRSLKMQKLQDSAWLKLLLLGTGESGKSTIFKQMKMLYGQGYIKKERQAARSAIYSNIIEGAQAVISKCEVLGFPLEGKSNEAANLISDLPIGTNYTSDEIADAIKVLWLDENFQSTLKLRAKYQVSDCFPVFAKKLAYKYPLWGGRGWVPDPDDCLLARVRTSGIVEERYCIDGAHILMCDVGGQRNERKKWIHCFENVTGIVFVCAISEYDQVLYEDNSQNRLVEAVELFDEIVNMKWFVDTSIILFLNKKDLFFKKFIIERVPLDVSGLPLFDTWKGIDWNTTSNDAALGTAYKWILKQFLDRRADKTKLVYHHVTCAMDGENIRTVFNACRDIIVNSNLKGMGMM